MRQRDRRHRHLQRHPLRLDAAQHLVEVETAMQPHRRAGLGGGQQVEQPEDVRRRRRDLKAVVRAEPERGHPVRWSPAPMDAWVWRTAFGSPVVPELKTSTASSSRAPGPGRRAVSEPSTSTVEQRRGIEVVDPLGTELLGQQRRRVGVGDPRTRPR